MKGFFHQLDFLFPFFLSFSYAVAVFLSIKSLSLNETDFVLMLSLMLLLLFFEFRSSSSSSSDFLFSLSFQTVYYPLAKNKRDGCILFALLLCFKKIAYSESKMNLIHFYIYKISLASFSTKI